MPFVHRKIAKEVPVQRSEENIYSMNTEQLLKMTQVRLRPLALLHDGGRTDEKGRKKHEDQLWIRCKRIV